MSNDKTSKDFELDDLEKPLTEQEMKETIGGAITPELHAPVSIPPIVGSNSGGGARNFTAGQFGQTPTPVAPVTPVIFTPPPPPNPFSHSIPAAPKPVSAQIPLPPKPSNGSGTIPIPQEIRDRLGL